ncbi:SusC/RagA family TonB-linked outer membrane protein [Winogradskyella maritima]|uniref:SusC/RagA family TonB-linked outer membrane protein n=1 Tax=Winogradskyella maritima TaxID=1517766 RepID=A0ABV8AFB2_9FLAO|nr:SusC/RagA family TonB-linked outer membrane protein [Winogradskyella maritima]
MKTYFNAVLFALLFMPILIFGQSVSGTVTDGTNGLPLPGVNVLVKGTTTGTSTDFDGKYTLNVSNGNVLVFSYLGFVTQEVTYNGQNTINIGLVEDASQLDEIVLIGYGTTTVKDATGSVESVTEEDFTRGNIVTADNLISGRVAGVNVTTDGGAPGSGSTIRIRGGSSINASNNPLIIIDGLPITNDNVGGSRGILSSLNPNDIESFSVLKDASATAIYGSRASNGVIIISTKKGRKTFSADIDTQYTFGEIDERIDVLSADEFRDLVNSQPITGATLDTSLLGNANTDWQDEIFRETVSAIHNVTLRGELFKFLPTRFSFGVSRQEGALITSLNERRNLSLSLNPSFFDDHLKVNINANMAFEDNRFADRSQIGQALRYDPTQPVRDGNPFFAGFYQHTVPGNNSLIANGGTNPIFNLLQRNNQGDLNRLFGNINLDYKFHFLPELRAVLNLGYDHSESNTSTFARFATQDVVRGETSFFNQQRVNRSLDGYLNYANDSGDVFDYDVSAGYSYQVFTNDGGFTGNLQDPQTTGDTFADPDIVLIGFWGRLNLDFYDKYLLTLNYRRDGTSRFSEDNQWGNFGGAALAWRLSDEDFLKDSNTISELKLRASVGWNGQQEIGQTDIFLSRLRQGNENSIFQFGNMPVQTLLPSAINPDIKWEETRTIEFGIDYGLFDNRFTGSLNVFQKDSEDLLFAAPVPDGSNFTNNIIQNIGEFRIQGLEFSVNADVFREGEFNWNANFNATLLDRDITSLPFGADIPVGPNPSGTGGNIQLQRQGEAPSSFFVFKQLYDANGAPIEGAYVDLNGDNIINDQDRYIRENPNPNALFGFQSNMTYKNFDFSFNLRASVGGYVYNNVASGNAQYALLQDQSVLGNIPTSVFNTNFQQTSDVVLSDLYVEEASFLRMDNITLGYTFNFEKAIKSIRLWGGVQNAFIITDYSGLDPEVGESGFDSNIFPRTRNFLVGANFKF